MKTIQNHDTGSLKVGTNNVQVGSQIRVQAPGYEKTLTVTYVARGAVEERTCVYFKKQGPIPTGQVSFEILAEEKKAEATNGVAQA